MPQPRPDPPPTGYPYLDEPVLDPPGGVLAMAHRGGAKHPETHGLENTMAAFRHAVGLGYRYLETDVHATSDGVLVAVHDASLERVTGRAGRIAELTHAQVARARIGGEHAVPTMAELLEELPEARFNVDLKVPATIGPMVDLIERHGAHDRLCIGSFDARSITRFRRLTGGRVATSASPVEVAEVLAVPRLVRRLVRRTTGARGPSVLQVPHRRGPVPLVTRHLLRQAHAAGLHVHVWTVDEPAEMAELLDLGVDGLITDRTDLLRDVLVARGLWREHP